MIRYKLKCGGHPRKKALLGADGAIMAAATLAAAGMNVAATLKSASSQAKAVENSAKTQAAAIKAQTTNNNQLQQESLNFTRQQNKENRDQQQDIQTTLQMLAGQENMNDRLDKSKVAVKYGGSKNLKAKSKMHTLLYGGASIPFKVTDGGGVIPINIDDNGYGLYEIYGNDHDHYHKTQSGKYKSGVGFKFNDGTVVEGEGNQNTTKGEKLFITPNDVMFISKHNIAGFNPAKAVDNGMNPVDAFAIQQQLKAQKGINDDGSKMSLPRRKGLFGLNTIINAANQTQYPSNGTVDVASGVTYNTVQQQNAVAKCGIHKKLRFGGRSKAANGTFWQNHAGATYNAIGNVLGAGINVLGNYFAGNKLSKAYTNAGNILANAYNQMTGIDLSSLSREDYTPAHAMAVIRSADTNINPQLERLRRNADSERKEVNRNTLSSAARQQRLAGINDRMYQRAGELYATKHNEDEKIKQQNASNIQDISKYNAQLDSQANKEFTNARLSLMQYNNNIANAKIAGNAQSLADAATQSASIASSAMQNSANAIGSALTSIGQGFANSYDAQKKQEADFNNVMAGADTSAAINYLVRSANTASPQTKTMAQSYFDAYKNSTDPTQLNYAKMLASAYGFVMPSVQ